MTGTSTGIGFATAVTLARAGHDVWATMRTPARAPQLQALAKQEDLPITVLPLDVDDDASVSGAVAHLLAARGRIDVLVNNAGIAPMGAIEELPLAEFRRAMETNYFGAVRCIQAVLPTMRDQRQGCLINVTSVAGQIALAATAPYTASKFALEALSEGLQHPGGDRRARRHSNTHSRQNAGRAHRNPVSTRAAPPGALCGLTQAAGVPGRGGRADPAHY